MKKKLVINTLNILLILLLTTLTLADNHTTKEQETTNTLPINADEQQQTLNKTKNFYLALWIGSAGALLIIIFFFFFFKKPKDPWKKKSTKQKNIKQNFTPPQTNNFIRPRNTVLPKRKY